MPSAELTAYLDGLGDTPPDMSELRDLGASLGEAVAICNARRKPEPVPPPIIARHVTPAPELMDEDAALWQLAELADMIAKPRTACSTLLHRAGFSQGTAEELANLIRSTRPRN